ncbi:zmpB [Symbiodinium sp. CCMP2592]|nr:zmpB [Symbiodinium sp. CCMP2592]
MAARERREKLRAAQREKAAAQLEKAPLRRLEETTAGAQESRELQSSQRVVEETAAEPVARGPEPAGSRESAAEELPALEESVQQTGDRPEQEAKTEVQKVSSTPSTKEPKEAKTSPAEAPGRLDEESRVESADVEPSVPAKPVVEEAAIADDASLNLQEEDATQRRARLRSSRRSTVSVQALPRRGSRASENAREDADASQRRREGLQEALDSSHRALQRLTKELFLGVQVDHVTGRSLRISPSTAQLEDLRAEHHDAFHRRLLKVATACAFDNMALIAQQRSAQQAMRKAQWRTCEDFRQEARAKEILQRRGRLAANHAQDVSSRCAEEAGDFVHQLQVLEEEVSPEKRAELESCQTALREECKSLAESVTAFRLLAESLAVPSADGTEMPSSLLTGTWAEQKLGLGRRNSLAADRRERSLATAARREGPWPPQLPLEEPLVERLQAEKEAWRQEAGSGFESSEESPSEEDEEWPARVAAAMALLDQHQPKPVKVRMAGLRQSTIGDQDTFKRLVAEKFAEAINIDSEEIRVKNIRGGTPRA